MKFEIEIDDSIPKEHIDDLRDEIRERESNYLTSTRLIEPLVDFFGEKYPNGLLGVEAYRDNSGICTVTIGFRNNPNGEADSYDLFERLVQNRIYNYSIEYNCMHDNREEEINEDNTWIEIETDGIENVEDVEQLYD